MKKNYILTIVSVVFMLFFMGCASIKVLDVPLISMTHATSDAPVKLKSVGEVKGEFCPGTFEEAGLLDSVVQKVQKQYKVDYIKEATVFMKGSCMEILGEGVTIQK